MKKQHAELICIIDRSGSMSGTENEVIKGINDLVKEQADIDGTANISLVLFDNQIERPLTSIPLSKWEPLTSETYYTRGSTAMNDAIGSSIDMMGEKFASMDESERPEKVIVAILTDGMENASTDYTQEKIKEMISHQTNTYGWDFAFLAANIDSQSEGLSRGFCADACASYSQVKGGTTNAMRSMSSTLTSYRTGAK